MQSGLGDDVDNTVKTSQALFTYDQISSALPNDAISKITQLTITAGPDPMSPFIRTNIESIMRIPNRGGYGDGSILLIFSSAGRLVVNGTEVIPATGDLATKNITELHSMAITKPIDIVNQGELCPCVSVCAREFDDSIFFLQLDGSSIRKSTQSVTA